MARLPGRPVPWDCGVDWTFNLAACHVTKHVRVCGRFHHKRRSLTTVDPPQTGHSAVRPTRIIIWLMMTMDICCTVKARYSTIAVRTKPFTNRCNDNNTDTNTFTVLLNRRGVARNTQDPWPGASNPHYGWEITPPHI